MTMARDTFKHAAIYSVANLLGKMAAFLLLPFYAHALGTEGYGVLGMVDASIALLTSVLAYGCQGAIIRLYHEQHESRKKLAVSTGYWVTFVSALVLAAVAMVMSPLLAGLLFGESTLSVYLCLALLCFFLDMNTQAASSVLMIQRKSLLFSALGLMRLVTGLSCNIAFIIVMEWGLFGYFLAGVLASLLHFVVAQHLCFRMAGKSVDMTLARAVIRFQWPLVPGALISFASRQTERIALRAFASIDKVGVLEMAYKFPALITMIIHEPFMNAWNTERIRLAQSGTPAAAAKIGNMFTFALFPLVCASLGIAVSIRDVLMLLTPPAFWQADRIAQIECLTLVLACTTQHVSLGYLHCKDTRQWSLLTSAISIAKICLSLGLVAAFGILGAAYSALCAAAVLLVLAWRGGQRRYCIRYRHLTNVLMVTMALFIFIASEWLAPAFRAQALHMVDVMTPLLPVHVTLFSVEFQDAVLAKLPVLLGMLMKLGLCLLMLGMVPVIYAQRKREPLTRGVIEERPVV